MYLVNTFSKGQNMLKKLRCTRSIGQFGIPILLCLLLSTACTNILAQSKTLPPLKQSPTTTPQTLSPFADAFPSTQPLICPGTNNSGTDSPTFVKAKGTQLTYKGLPLKLSGYTFYPSLIGGAAAWHRADFTDYIDHVLAMGASAGQNLIRPTDFWDRHQPTNAQENLVIWKNLDYLVCDAQQHGLFVNMDISAFAWLLMSKGYDAFAAQNWSDFLQAVGAHYQQQSSIAFYSILGEPAVPKTPAQMNALLDFYRSTTAILHNADGGHHLITAGGFNHMEDESPALPWWRLIYALPTNDLGAFKTYSQRDLAFMPTIAAYGKAINKPVFDEEFGMPQVVGDALYSGINYNNLRLSRAAFFDAVYSIGEAQGVAGFIFWNMGCEVKVDGYEVSPKTPAVWQVIQKYAPLKPDTTIDETKLCL
jgi:hypothetical protein